MRGVTAIATTNFHNTTIIKVVSSKYKIINTEMAHAWQLKYEAIDNATAIAIAKVNVYYH